MLEFLKKGYSKRYKDVKIPTTAHIMEDGITLHGEDPGTIPPDDTPNPLVDEVDK
jgi:hypothetical protein